MFLKSLFDKLMRGQLLRQRPLTVLCIYSSTVQQQSHTVRMLCTTGNVQGWWVRKEHMLLLDYRYEIYFLHII